MTVTPEALAQALLESRTDAILATDRNGLIVYWNPGAVRLFGYPVGEAIGASLDIIIPPGLQARHWEGFHQVMKTGVTRYGQGEVLAVPGLTREGQRVSLEFSITMLRNASGQLVGMAAVMRDVTALFEELKRLRQAVSRKDPLS